MTKAMAALIEACKLEKEAAASQPAGSNVNYLTSDAATKLLRRATAYATLLRSLRA